MINWIDRFETGIYHSCFENENKRVSQFRLLKIKKQRKKQEKPTFFYFIRSSSLFISLFIIHY